MWRVDECGRRVVRVAGLRPPPRLPLPWDWRHGRESPSDADGGVPPPAACANVRSLPSNDDSALGFSHVRNSVSAPCSFDARWSAVHSRASGQAGVNGPKRLARFSTHSIQPVLVPRLKPASERDKYGVIAGSDWYSPSGPVNTTSRAAHYVPGCLKCQSRDRLLPGRVRRVRRRCVPTIPQPRMRPSIHARYAARASPPGVAPVGSPPTKVGSPATIVVR